MNKKQKKAILIDVISPETSEDEALLRLEELESLVSTYGGVVVMKTLQKKGVPDYKTYIGSGKCDDLIDLMIAHQAEVLVINNLLKPRQLFNLNEKLRKDERFQEDDYLRKKDIQAWDRVDLILKIFAKHAKTSEAKLQIELAGIKHMGPRIYDMGRELMQQGGAVGLRGGQGETNTEIMKRHLANQEKAIMKKLNHYAAVRDGHRRRRKRQNLKTAAIVGYTNAGKSSLINALTNKGSYVADQLFATLDTRVAKLYLPGTAKHGENGEYTPGKEILLSDTIGFIQDLPPELIKAFKSTLAETVHADLLLHVIDISDPQIERKIQCVEDILTELGAGDNQKIYVFNKIDLIRDNEFLLQNDKREILEVHKESHRLVKAGKGVIDELGWSTQEKIEKERKKKKLQDPESLREKYKEFHPVFVSAHEGRGFEGLLEGIKKEL
jgi:GTPase